MQVKSLLAVPFYSVRPFLEPVPLQYMRPQQFSPPLLPVLATLKAPVGLSGAQRRRRRCRQECAHLTTAESKTARLAWSIRQLPSLPPCAASGNFITSGRELCRKSLIEGCNGLKCATCPYLAVQLNRLQRFTEKTHVACKAHIPP